MNNLHANSGSTDPIRVDVSELDACMKRLKGSDVQNQGGGKPLRRVVTALRNTSPPPTSNSATVGIEAMGSDSGTKVSTLADTNVASKGSDVVGDPVSAPRVSMLQDDGNSQGGTNEAEKVGLGDVDSSPLRDLGSLSPRDDNMEQLPNQGKPVSLGNVGNIIINNDKVVLDDVE